MFEPGEVMFDPTPYLIYYLARVKVSRVKVRCENLVLLSVTHHSHDAASTLLPNFLYALKKIDHGAL